MMNESGINNDQLVLTNEENNEGVISSSIILTDEVMIIFDNLIIEQFRHQDYQSNCFEDLINIWFGENYLVTSSTLDIKKETERFETNYKDYILQTISKYLPDGEDKLYLAYYSLKNTGNYVEYNTDGECTIYHKNQIDIKQYSKYIEALNAKILRQYNILKHNFGVYLKEKLEDAELENNAPVLFQLRKSARITKKTDYKPMLQWNKTKTKKTITHYLRTNTTSNTTSKKRKVNPLND